MKSKKIIIGSRGSKLALIYAKIARNKIFNFKNEIKALDIKIKIVRTKGDQIQNNQKACINMLKEANFSVKCLKVNDFVCEYDWDSGKKKKK